MGALNKMGALEDILLITIKANAAQATATFNKLGKTIQSIFGPIKSITGAISTSQRRLKGWQNPVDVINAKFGQTTGRVKNIDQIVRQTTKSMDSLNKRARTFDMRLLSLLFGGMALRRAFGGMLRSIFNTFKMAEDETSGLNQATVRLSASWEFLKFSIMDALNTDWFINFIDGLIRTIRWFSQLKDGWKITFLSISGGLFILGTGLMLIGQIKLGWDAIFGMGGFLNSTNKIHAKTLGASGVLTKLRNFALVGLGIKVAFDLANYLSGDINLRKLIDSLGTDLALIGLVSGKPWVIAVGIALKLIPFGERISTFGKSLMEKGFERVERAKAATIPLDVLKGLLPTVVGGFETGIGAAITGIGTSLEFIDAYILSVDASTTSTQGLADVIDEDLNPIIKTSSDVINNNKDSLNEGLKTTGKEMDIISGEKTENFVISSKERIQQIEDEIAVTERLIIKNRELFDAFQETSLEHAAGSSSVSS